MVVDGPVVALGAADEAASSTTSAPGAAKVRCRRRGVVGDVDLDVDGDVGGEEALMPPSPSPPPTSPTASPAPSPPPLSAAASSSASCALPGAAGGVVVGDLGGGPSSSSSTAPALSGAPPPAPSPPSPRFKPLFAVAGSAPAPLGGAGGSVAGSSSSLGRRSQAARLGDGGGGEALPDGGGGCGSAGCGGGCSGLYGGGCAAAAGGHRGAFGCGGAFGGGGAAAGGGWLWGFGALSSSASSSSSAASCEALRRDILAFHDRHEDALADLILHLADGQVVLANRAIVEARLPKLVASAEPLNDADPAALVLMDGDRGGRRAEVVRQLRLSGMTLATLDALLRWAYGEAVPSVADLLAGRSSAAAVGSGALGGGGGSSGGGGGGGGGSGAGGGSGGGGGGGGSGGASASSSSAVASSPSTLSSTQVVFDILQACGQFELERLGALMRDALLQALDVDHFGAVLRETHMRSIPGLKQGCMRFALHHFDELIERPEVFLSPLQELPEVLGDLFRLSRCWKDGTGDGRDHKGRSSSPRPAPAPPSTFVCDLERLYTAARAEDERRSAGECCADEGQPPEEDEGSGASVGSICCRAAAGSWRDLAPDCRLCVGEDAYCVHSAVLAARSDFFFAAFATDMAERTLRTVTLQHVRGETPGRESVLALLYFLYTGRTTKVTEHNALELLALIGGACGGELDEAGAAETSGSADYLQLHDTDTLRRACEAAAESACYSGSTDRLLDVLVQADSLGASRLKARALQLAVHHFKDLALKDAFVSLPPALLSEVLRLVAVEFDGALPSAAKGLPWELSVLPEPDTRLKNTQEALISPDLSCGAGASGTAGCSEASVVATFDRPVRVRRVRIGVDLTTGDFDASRLRGSKLQYINSSGTWQDTGVSVSEEDGMVRELDLPKVVTARAFRLVRKQRIALGLLVFE